MKNIVIGPKKPYWSSSTCVASESWRTFPKTSWCKSRKIWKFGKAEKSR